MADLNQPLVNPIQNYILEKCEITTHTDQKIDLLILYSEINFYESIFSPVLLGSILIPDYFNYVTYGPLIGGEEIVIKIRNIPASQGSGEQTEKGLEYFYHTFTVLSVENRTIAQNRLQLYDIKFCSKEALYNQQLRLSTTFLKKRYSDIAEDVMDILFAEQQKLNPEERKDNPERTKKYLEKLAEKNGSSEPSVTVHFPNLHPFDCIQYLMGKATSGGDSNKANPYFFYESFNRRYYFGSFKDHFCFNHSKGKSLNVNEVNFTDGNKVIIFNNNQISVNQVFSHKKVDFFAALSTVFPKDFDYLENIKKGVYAHTLYTYDYTEKKIKKFGFSYKRDYTKIPHIYESQDNALMIKDGAKHFKNPFYSETFVKTAFTHKSLFFTDQQDLTPELTKNYRYEKFQELNNNFFELTIPGDIGCFSGKFFDLYLNSPDVTTNKELKSDPHFSGTYFCLQVRHCFKHENFITSMELCKDSFMEKTLQTFPEQKP